jgi:spermidine synthase
MLGVPSQRVVLARHPTPTGEIQLQQRPLADGSLAFEIIVDGVFLMASYNQTSERALAHCALDALLPQAQSDRRLLIGGLGMGFTLQEALLTPQVTAIDVVEISPNMIEWNRTHFAPLNGYVLANPRVTLLQEDAYTILHAHSQRGVQYHAILLDVDNGPSWLVHEDNARLYTTEALQRWARLLVPGGCFAVWSAQRESEFLEQLRTVFGRAEEILVEATSEKGRIEQFVYRAAVVSF